MPARLDPRFDPLVAGLAARHVGDRAAIIVCGMVQSEPTLVSELTRAEFIVTVPDLATAERLAGVLQVRSCPDAPSA